MGRGRYKIYEPTHPHFLTCTVLHWLPIFTNVQSTQIILESLAYLQKHDNLKVYAYVILENHLHLVAQSNDISRTMQKFKSYTAKELLALLKEKNTKTLLEQFAFYKKAYKRDTTYQIWEEGLHPQLMQTDRMMIDKIHYIHNNPVKRGYVDKPHHWRYSSARNYEGTEGLLDIERFW